MFGIRRRNKTKVVTIKKHNSWHTLYAVRGSSWDVVLNRLMKGLCRTEDYGSHTVKEYKSYRWTIKVVQVRQAISISMHIICKYF